MSVETLTRFAQDAGPEERRAFAHDLVAALDRLEVGPGDAFLISAARESTRAGITDPGENRLGHFAAGSETSRKAALMNYPRSGSQRHAILTELLAAGEDGRTSDELHVKLGFPLASVKPRLIELREGGFARQRGDTRKSLTGAEVDVYVATGKTKAESTPDIGVDEGSSPATAPSEERPDWMPVPATIEEEGRLL